MPFNAGFGLRFGSLNKVLAVLLVLVLEATQNDLHAENGQTGNPSQQPSFWIAENGPNHRIWKSVDSQTNSDGKVLYRTNSYTELASGLNHLVNGQWIASSQEIQITQDGGAAVGGQHQVFFDANINVAGAIHLVTPEGGHLRSHIAGLAYYDASSGRSVMIAELQDSTGMILSPGNQVLYTNAFTDFAADVLYTYSKAGFEQDIVLREQPPSPAEWNLNPQTTWLQVWTEFTEAPAPRVTPIADQDAGWQDEQLNFGTMQLSQGRAFSIGGSGDLTPVSKHWETVDGRTFLIESVPIGPIAVQLQNLPRPSSGPGRNSSQSTDRSLLRHRFDHRLVWARKVGGRRTGPMRLVSTAVNRQGLVLDYNFVTAITNFTFQADTTYYVSAPVVFTTVTGFEGGAVIKYNTNASIILTGSALNWQASPYRPVIFTAMDDNSVGAAISNSTGLPSGYYASPALEFMPYGATNALSHLRISHAQTAIQTVYHPLDLCDGQIIHCQAGMTLISAEANLGNMLFADNSNNIVEYGATSVQVQNATFNDSAYLASAASSGLVFTNCLLANIGSLTPANPDLLTGSHNGFYNCPAFGANIFSNGIPPFLAVGGGSYYLSSNSYRGVGSTNIQSSLLADLRQKTTYPPIVYSNITITSNSVFYPTVPRDTNGSSVDFGYHYDPLDYALGAVQIGNDVTVLATNGVAIGFYGISNNARYGYGMEPSITSQFISQGTPLTLNRMVEFSSVQEQSSTGWVMPSYGLMRINYAATGPYSLDCRFTDFSIVAQDTGYFSTEFFYLGVPVGLQDCQIHGGVLGISSTSYLTNCLLERVRTALYPYINEKAAIFYLRNCLVWGGSFTMKVYNTNSLLQNNEFHGAVLSDETRTNYVSGFNAYYGTVGTFLKETNSTDIFLDEDPGFQTGSLGNYYQPSSSPLVNMGSTTSDHLGLYWYTTQTSQSPEGYSIVDIGYHYVALGANGLPLEDTNGIPLYLEYPDGPPSTSVPWTLPQNLNLISPDYAQLALPQVGDFGLHILSPTILELVWMNTQSSYPVAETVPDFTFWETPSWSFVETNGLPSLTNGILLNLPATNKFSVTINGSTAGVSAAGFKRRVLYESDQAYDIRVENCLYLELTAAVPVNAAVVVQTTNASLWPTNVVFSNSATSFRYSPAIHVNQEGYVRTLPKQAMVGYYMGGPGEMPVATNVFDIVNCANDAIVYSGVLKSRPDIGWSYSPPPYQNVWMADFSGFTNAGEYQLVVPGCGASLPFMVSDGTAMDFVRTYELGLYEQRCGTNNELPYTRFTHDACHTNVVSVPVPDTNTNYSTSWYYIQYYATNQDYEGQTARLLTNEASILPYFAFTNLNDRTNAFDAIGGHHDAGDYSKYTVNCASLVHYLMLTVDCIPGASNLDNLGIPESGDGISDILQEAKWEADYLCKIQDNDGGFYFLVYPLDSQYEFGPPGSANLQAVWPKNSAATAAAVAALAECASSPLFKTTYPTAASNYLVQALSGWKCLTNAIAKSTNNPTNIFQGIYQTSYGQRHAGIDELAWAACELYLATKTNDYHQKLTNWFNPLDEGTWGLYGNDPMSSADFYSHVVQSYAFAVQSGRANSNQLDATFLANCQAVITLAASNAVVSCESNAYGTCFPINYGGTGDKQYDASGFYFSDTFGFALVAGYLLMNSQSNTYLTNILTGLNYERGCNPVNICYVAGNGWKRQRSMASQMAEGDGLVLPPTGFMVANMQDFYDSKSLPGFPNYFETYVFRNSTYSFSQPDSLCYPSQTYTYTNPPYPLYDRWTDTRESDSEMITLNLARGLASAALVAGLAPPQTNAYIPANTAVITLVTNTVSGTNDIIATFSPPSGMDARDARVLWDVQYQEPSFGTAYTFIPSNAGNGPRYIHAEAQWPDGRRSFATNAFTWNPGLVIWIEDAIPAPLFNQMSDGGDTWGAWVVTNPAPFSGNYAFQSSIGAQEHQLYFTGANHPLSTSTGDTLFAYIYIDPKNPPTEVMLQWHDVTGSWDHRVYWGNANNPAGWSPAYYETNVLPSNQWLQLSVPASAVNLEGIDIDGMAFTLYGGRAAWDHAGKASQGTPIH